MHCRSVFPPDPQSLFIVTSGVVVLQLNINVDVMGVQRTSLRNSLLYLNLCHRSLFAMPQEEEMLSILVQHGVRSGKTGTLGMEVDGLTFHPTHSDLIIKLRDRTSQRK